MADASSTTRIDPAAVGAEPSPAAIAVPERVGAVRLGRPIGEGGMGVVYRGTHEMLGRAVAVKFLTRAIADAGDPTFRAFVDGARAAAAVKHPGLTEVYDAGVLASADATGPAAPGQFSATVSPTSDAPHHTATSAQTQPSPRFVPFLVMELVDGPGLDAILRAGGGTLPLPAALEAIRQACEAIGELHGAGFVHRDIKPANLLVDSEGRVRVTDFGLSCERPTRGVARVAVAGTPTYMAPEMFEGEVSARSDVYALAATLYEMLAGRPPHAGADLLSLRDAHRAGEIAREPLEAAGAPPTLIEAIVRGLNPNPMLRPRTALHLLDSIRAGLRDREAWDAGPRMLRDAARNSRAVGTNTRNAAATPSSSYYKTLTERAEARRSAATDVAGETDIVPPADSASEPARAARDSPGPSEPAPTLTSHVPCIRCQYDLIGTPISASCPECSAPVSDSIPPDRLIFADRTWLRRVRSGCRLIVIGVALLPALMLVIALILVASNRAPTNAVGAAIGLGAGFGYITAQVLLVIGIVAATAAEPGRAARLERTARAAWILGLGALVASGIVSVAFPTSPGVAALLTVGMHLVLLGAVLLGRHVAAIAARIPDARLVRSGRSTLGPWIALVCIWAALVALRPSGLGSDTFNPRVVLRFGVLIATLHLAVLASQASKRLGSVIRNAADPVLPRASAPPSPRSGTRFPWRTATVASAVFLVALVPLFLLAPLCRYGFHLLAERAGLLVEPTKGFTLALEGFDHVFHGRLPVGLDSICSGLLFLLDYGVPLALGLWVFARSALRPPRDGITRCGWCGYTLAGLREARCPECGVAIGSRPTGPIPSPRSRRVIWGRLVWALPVFMIAFAALYEGAIRPLGIPEPKATIIGIATIILGHLPPFGLALLVAWWFTRGLVWPRGLTRCGHCGEPLRTLPRGACESCGGSILLPSAPGSGQPGSAAAT